MEETIKIAREKYVEITEIFPNNPEGFYGISIRSPMIGDIKNGIRDIDIAINKNNYENVEALLLKAMLLTLDQRLEESLYHCSMIKIDSKDNDDFQANYALSLYEVSKKTNDKEQLWLARKHFRKIRNEISKHLDGRL